MSSLSLEDSVQWVKGVGPRRAKLLSRCSVETVRDFIYLAPRRYLDRSEIKLIKDVQIGEEVTVEGDIVSIDSRKSRRGTLITDIVVYDGTGMVKARWFNQKWVEKRFKKGERLFLSGKVDYFRGLQLLNPDYESLTREESEQIHTGRIIPLYPLTKGLGQRFMRRTISFILKETLDKLKDPLPKELQEKYNLMPLSEALNNLHFPLNKELLRKAKRKLSFEELLNLQLFLELRKEEKKNCEGISFNVESALEKKFLSSLPFELTYSQKKVLSEIKGDMNSSHPMNRLLQGDVGSGKTVVAIAAMLIAVDNGFHSVMMAPTEILAYQHYFVLKEFLSSISIPLWILAGGMNPSRRDEILSEITEKRGMIVGTHALLEEDVKIPELGLIIIDEQHRFGVMQRATIQKKGREPDVLVMTATPIPRTLAISVYGDLEVSTIDELPPGRISQHTRWVKKEKKRKEVYKWVNSQVSGEGVKAYIVLPLIEESDKMDLCSIEREANFLINTFFPDCRVGILHGRMNREEKETIMNGFRGSEFDILICTTVIEVGIDVPEANIMVVENADRFGLAALHQLRGRIGRGGERSYFIMLAPEEDITDNARERLKSLENISDGFQLSEVDLRLRGPGEFFGTRQHGFPDFKFFDPLKDRRIIGQVRNAVREIIDKGWEDRFSEGLREIRKGSEFIDVG